MVQLQMPTWLVQLNGLRLRVYLEQPQKNLGINNAYICIKRLKMNKTIKTIAVVGGGILAIHLLRKKGLVGEPNLKQASESLPEEVTPEAKFEREVIIEKSEEPSVLEFAGNITTSSLLAIPTTRKVAYSQTEVEALSQRFDELDSEYGRLFSQVAGLTRIPLPILKGFCMIESGGNPNVSTSCCVGFMALNSQFAGAVIYNEAKKGRLSDGERNYLIKYLGASRFNAQVKSGKNVLTRAEIKRPEINLMLGAIMLGQLMDKYTYKGKIRWEFVIGEYNWNYRKSEKLFTTYKSASTDTIIANASMPKETKNYIVKLLGKNGVLDIQIA